MLPGANSLLLVSDPLNERVQTYNAVGELQPLKLPGRKISQLATGPQGEIYALNSADGLVIKYDKTGKQIAQWDGSSGGKKFNLPDSLTTDKDGNLYVADTGNQLIQKFDKDGKFMLKFGGRGSSDGSFGGSSLYQGPTSIAVEPASGNIYVVDPIQNRVQKFDAAGKFLKSITKPDPSTNRPFRPVAVAVAPASTAGVYIVAREGIYKLNNQDKAAAKIYANTLIEDGDTGDGNINSLNSLVVDGSGNLFATDNFGRLQKFRLK